MNFELILSTESRVLSTNIVDFEKRADQFLSTLTNKFETDDDFVAAKEEVKTLKEVEDKIRVAIKSAQNGEIADLITSAENIAERFRQERLKRDKLVKEKEAEVKTNIINNAFEHISKVRYGYESDISLALERTMPKSDIQTRLKNATARRSTLATLKKAVHAEETLILAELGQESARLTERRKLIPASAEHLFKDWLELIIGDDDLASIVEMRLNEEAQREQALREQAKQAAEAQRTQAEVRAVADEIGVQSAVEKTQENQTALSNEPIFNFEIRIAFTGTQEQAINLARKVKAQYGDNVSLKKMN
jgi:hypothetical protein